MHTKNDIELMLHVERVILGELNASRRWIRALAAQRDDDEAGYALVIAADFETMRDYIQERVVFSRAQLRVKIARRLKAPKK